MFSQYAHYKVKLQKHILPIQMTREGVPNIN